MEAQINLMMVLKVLVCFIYLFIYLLGKQILLVVSTEYSRCKPSNSEHTFNF